MTILFFFIFLLYFILVVALIAGWNMAIKKKSIVDQTVEPFISVVIPARNEANNIGRIVNDIKNQDYTAFEVIIVDDHSDDQTQAFARDAIANDGRFQISRSQRDGKKEALTHGIALAKGTIIVTTDADCSVPKSWLTNVNKQFRHDDVKMAFGAVKIQEEANFFSVIQAIEFSSLIGSGVATHAFGFPTMCNGANLAFRKATFDEVDGYGDNVHIPSGDDEFLLRKVFAKYPHGIAFINQPEATVSTGAQRSCRTFVNQRIRWAGKWKHHRSYGSMMLGLFIFLVQLCSLVLPILTIAGSVSLTLCLFLVSIKIVLEFIFLKGITTFLRNKWSWRVFLLLEAFYPAYVVFIGFLSNFRSFYWKGRRLTSIQSKTF